MFAAAFWTPSLSAATQRDDLEQSAAARNLFAEGLAFADAKRWGEAADRFERARSLRPTAEITYNLSTALMRLQQLVRASELLRQIAGDAQAPPAVKGAARARLAEVLPRIAYLTVKVPVKGGGGGGDGGGRVDTSHAAEGTASEALVVLVDGRPFDNARLGVPLPVDPTAHTVHLRQGTTLLERREILLDEGERRTISFETTLVPLVAYTPVNRSFSAKGQPALAATANGDRGGTWVWWLVGAAVVGLTATTMVALKDSPGSSPGDVDTWTLGKK